MFDAENREGLGYVLDHGHLTEPFDVPFHLIVGQPAPAGRLGTVFDFDQANVSVSYLLYGIDVSPETAEVIRLLEENPKKRKGIITILTDEETA